jgi:transposase
VIMGLEASGYSSWFVELLEGLGHQVHIGDAAEVRRLAKRRQKNDRRDAELILDLLLEAEFPRIHRPPLASREVLRHLRYRHKLVQMCTRAKNNLQALAFSAGSAGRSKLLSRAGRGRFLELPMSEAMSRQREEWLSLVEEFNRRIKSLDRWLDEQARVVLQK